MVKVLSVLCMVFLTVFCYAAEKELIGAGATFPQPFYTKLFDVYFQKTGIKVNYQGVGSGSGINLLIDKVVDFAGTDAYMTQEEMRKAGSAVLHIPTCIGAVVITYNLAGDPEIRLTPELISDIFLGKINRWDHPKIRETNPGVSIPSIPIVVVRRSDSSGTTYVFSEYLSKTVSEWKERMGIGKSLNWPPFAIGQRGNPGVAGYVRSTPGAIGYVELTYALQNKMPCASVKNRAGNFIKPSVDSLSEAAKVKIPDDTNISLTNTESPKGYPISSFTWIAFYREQNYGKRTKERALALGNLLNWIVDEGQTYAKPLDYGPLSKEAIEKAKAVVKMMTFGGQRIFK